MLRLLVCGNRDWTDRDIIRETFEDIQRKHCLDGDQITLIHGGNGRRRSNGKAWRGADLIASDVATELGWHVIEVPAQWYLHPSAAGPIRNRRMVHEFGATHGVAFGRPGTGWQTHRDRRLRGSDAQGGDRARLGVEGRIGGAGEQPEEEVMTCVVGVKDGKTGGVVLGGDSAASNGAAVISVASPKVFSVGPYAFGFTESWRLGQILRYAVNYPDPPRSGALRHAVLRIIPAIREAMKREGASIVRAPGEGGDHIFLVAWGAHLFCVDSEWHVGEHAEEYASVGSGAYVALGSLYTTRGLPARRRAALSLAAAAAHVPEIRPPFRFVHTRETS